MLFFQTATGFFLIRPRAGGYDLPPCLSALLADVIVRGPPAVEPGMKLLMRGFLSAVGGFTRRGAAPDTGGLFSLGSQRLGLIEAFTGDSELLSANGV